MSGRTLAHPARDAALRLLGRVLRTKRFLDAAEADEAERLAALAPRDRAMARRLAGETLRRLRLVDEEIARFLKRPLPARSHAVRDVLRLAASEMLYLGAKPHAAVDAAVTLAKARDPRLAGLVNAVSRRLAERAAAGVGEDAAQGRRAAPDWLAARLDADWGGARADAIMAAHLAAAPLDLTLKPGAAAPEALGGAATPTGSRRLVDPGPVSELAGYAEGHWWVQDAAAALPARLLEARPGERVLDLCAAPGGKTLQLAAAGAAVTALDVSAARSRRVSENLARTRLDAEIVVEDARAHAPSALYDAVLLDAPCSATGTLRRHPDLAHVKDGDGLEELTALQDALVDAALRVLRPGGRLVFCTCSLFREEGEARADAALARAPDLAPWPIDAPPVGAAPFLDAAQGRLRTTPDAWPEIGGLDGFFAARFVKSGG